jgi:hypothetical protein
MDKDKFRKISYVQGDTPAQQLVNQRRFKKLSLISPEESIYECEMSHKKITIDLPIHLALCVLQLSKLRIFKLYYNYLNYYISRENQELCCMDTDSLYISFSNQNIDCIIKKEK